MIIRSLPYADLLEDAGVGLILYEGRLVRVSALALAIVALAEPGIALDDLAEALERRFGMPEGASALDATNAAVTDLSSQGVVVADDDAPGGSR
jgi:hypothetical protein